MAIKLSDYKPCDEGRYIFKIVSVDYNEDFGKLQINCENAKGDKHTERYSLLDNNGESNQKALGAFTFFAKTVLNDFDLEEIDEQDLVGHYFAATVTHDVVPSKKDPTKNNTYARINQCKWAEDFDDAAALEVDETDVPTAPKEETKVAPKEETKVAPKEDKPVAKPEPKPVNPADIDLDDLLG